VLLSGLSLRGGRRTGVEVYLKKSGLIVGSGPAAVVVIYRAPQFYSSVIYNPTLF
jgi:hypothetical protein